MKELIIIVYKINIAGLTRQQAEQNIQSFANTFTLREDEELKDNYIIREIFLPVINDESDVKIIYPVPRYTTSPEINELISEISDKIKEDPSNVLKSHWERLIRELKLRKIEDL